MSNEAAMITFWLSSVGMFVGAVIALRELKRHVERMSTAIERAFEVRDRRHAGLAADVEQLRRRPRNKHEAITVELPRARVVRGA